MAAFTDVSDLKPYKSMWKIKAKIIRLWKQFSASGGLTIEMVLCDSNGVKIHATVKKELVNKFDPFLSQGISKIFINFSLNHSCGSYRTTNHPYKIGFLESTRVRVCEDLLGSLSGFQPVNYRDVLDGSLNPDYLVDVIGQIVEVSPMEFVSVNGKDTQKVALELRNAGDERLPIVLWGNFASDVSNAIQLRGEQAVICVIRFAKIKVWKEDRSISNAYNVSEVELNPIMEEVEAFVSMLPKDDLSLAIVDNKHLSMVSGITERDDFFVHTPRKTISQLFEVRNVERCIVMCTVAAIDSDMGWYYLSCKVCAKKVQTVPTDTIDDEDDENPLTFSYYCVKCNCYNPKLLPRYKLHLVVLDNTSNTKFLLFDNLALQLIQQPCIELTGPNFEEMEDPEIVPLPLKNLVGKTYLFKISIEKENYLYKHDTFKVLKIMTNQDMIDEFVNRNDIQEHVQRLAPASSIISDAPEGSLMLSGGSSEECEPCQLTPAKRKGTTHIVNLEEAFDQNSVTRTVCLKQIKKEKLDKNGKSG